MERLLVHKKMKFSIKDFFSKCDKVRGFVTFTEEIPNVKLQFLCSAISYVRQNLQFNNQIFDNFD